MQILKNCTVQFWQRINDEEVSMVDEPVGRAYAFFSCSASLNKILSEVPKARFEARTPPTLEITLQELDITKYSGDLSTIAKKMKEYGANYSIEGLFPGKKNEDCANEIADIMNMLYTSELYTQGEPMIREITCEIDGTYMFRE